MLGIGDLSLPDFGRKLETLGRYDDDHEQITNMLFVKNRVLTNGILKEHMRKEMKNSIPKDAVEDGG
jgi:hypothetical protein